MAKNIIEHLRGNEKPMEYTTVRLPGSTPLLALIELARSLGCNVCRMPGGQLAIMPRREVQS